MKKESSHPWTDCDKEMPRDGETVEVQIPILVSIDPNVYQGHTIRRLTYRGGWWYFPPPEDCSKVLVYIANPWLFNRPAAWRPIDEK